MLVVRTRQLTTEDFHLIGRAALSAAPTAGLVTPACQTITLVTSCRSASPSQRLSGHVSHHAGWPASLMSKGSEGACTPSGVSTFLTYRFHGTVSACNSPKVTTSLGQR